MRFLALTHRPVESRRSGYDRRVANLCAYLPGPVHQVVAPRTPTAARAGLLLEEVFASVEHLTPPPDAPDRRRPRLSTGPLLHRRRPAARAASRARLEEVVREREITHVVVFGGENAELAADLPGVTVLLDVGGPTDPAAGWARPAGQGPRAWVRHSLALVDPRARGTGTAHDGAPHDVDLVTAVSDPDARVVGDAGSGTATTDPLGPGRVSVGPLPVAGGRSGVVFWGDLAFGPNRDALRSFVHDVWLPRLRDHGVELCVVGADAPGWLAELAATEPRVVLTGSVADLAAVVTRYPIMINPMRSGSGLRNKVLEAFGLGVVVVSTPLGVEAVPAAQDGTHLVLASGADDLAAAVLSLLTDVPRRSRLRRAAHALVSERYRWDAVGRAWVEAATPVVPADEGHSGVDTGAVPTPRTADVREPAGLRG